MPNSPTHALHARKAVVWTARFISYLLYIYLVAVEIILGLGFFLLLFGANPTAEFTQWVYRNLDRVMEPFAGIFAPIELGTTTADVEAIFDTAVLFAMIVYGILAMTISALTSWLTHRIWVLEAAEAAADARESAAPVIPTNNAASMTQVAAFGTAIPPTGVPSELATLAAVSVPPPVERPVP